MQSKYTIGRYTIRYSGGSIGLFSCIVVYKARALSISFSEGPRITDPQPARRRTAPMRTPSIGSDTTGSDPGLPRSAAKAYDEVRLRILDGRLQPGSRLREHVLAAEIGVSRTPIREALRKLAADGFVELVPNQGASVVEWSERSLVDLIDVRSELAAMATRLATPRIAAGQIDELERINARIAQVARRRQAGFLSEAAGLNLAFHRIVFAASGNDWLVQMLDQTAYLPLVQRAHHAFDPGAWKTGIARYAELIEALRARDDVWAATLIRAHFLAAKHSIIRAHHSEHGA